MASSPQQLLSEIATRKRLINLARRWYVATLVCAVIFVTTLITLRLVSLIEELPFENV